MSAKKDIDQKKLDAIGKKVREQLELALQLARDAGVTRPDLYIESEHCIYILDKDHPDYMSDSSSRSMRAVVAKIYDALPDECDVGAW